MATPRSNLSDSRWPTMPTRRTVARVGDVPPPPPPATSKVPLAPLSPPPDNANALGLSWANTAWRVGVPVVAAAAAWKLSDRLWVGGLAGAGTFAWMFRNS